MTDLIGPDLIGPDLIGPDLVGPDLVGQSAVVTGATSGIGKAIAKRLATLGAKVLLLGRSEAKLGELEQELARECEVEVDTFVLDHILSNFEDRCRLLADRIEGLDILIHSAGVLVPSDGFETTEVSDLDLQYRVNIRSPFVLTKALLSKLRDRKGQVVFINSSAARQKTKAGVVSYTAMKYALVALADGLRDEVNAQGIRVVSIFPGKTATPMQEQIYQSQNRNYNAERMLQPDDVAETTLATLALPRTAEVTDIDVRPFLKE